MAVQFNEPSAFVPSREKRTSFISNLVVKTGLVKTEAGAQLILLIVSVICLILAGYLFIGSSQEPPAPTPEQVVL